MRREIDGQGVHTEAINIIEIQMGDSLVFPTKGEKKKEKRVLLLGWEHLADLPQEAAEVILMRQFPKSIFDSRGQSSAGSMPSKMSEWEVGFGVAVEFPLAFAHEEQVVVLCKTAHRKYELLRSRESRYSKRFS